MSDAVRKKRMQLTEKDAATLEKYLKTDYSDIERQQMLDMGKVDGGYDLGKSLAGQGAFRDTGRESSGVGEAWDSIVGVPYRTAIDELQTADLSLENNPMKRVAKSLARVGSSVGTDPQNAPKAFDLAARATDNPYLGAGLATAIEVATPGTIPMPGVAATIYREGKALSSAQARKAMAELLAEKEKYLYHGTDRKVADAVGKGEPLVPDVGGIVKHAYGEYLDPNEYPDAIKDLVFMSDQGPGYINRNKWGSGRSVADQDVTRAHVKKKSGLAMIEPDNSFIKNVGDGDPDYRSLISKERTSLSNDVGSDITPINFERGDVVSENAVSPKYVLTDDDLVEFLGGAYPDRFPKLKGKGKLKAVPAKNILDEIDTAEKAVSDRRVPYKVSARDGELSLKSPKAKASASFRDLDSIDEMDPEMTAYLEKIGAQNPIYLAHLEAEKGFGAKALSQIEASAKKRGADAAYLNASPVGGARGLSQEEAAAKLREFYKKNGYEVAKDFGTNTMMYKKLLGEAGMAPGREALAIEKAINDRRKKRAK